MKIVIDIPDIGYDWIKNGFPDDEDKEFLIRAIISGTILPKGHGALVDADKVILGLVYGKHIDNAKCGEITKIFNNAVVIPADMRGKERRIHIKENKHD